MQRMGRGFEGQVVVDLGLWQYLPVESGIYGYIVADIAGYARIDGKRTVVGGLKVEDVVEPPIGVLMCSEYDIDAELVEKRHELAAHRIDIGQ